MRRLALPASAVVAAGLLVAVGAEAASGRDSATRPAVACVTERADVRSAAAVAKACGRRVEVLERRSEVRSEFANPDGTTTLQQWVAPTRVRRPGGWAAVDTTLRREGDGSVAPVAAANGLRLSGGGTGPLATVQTANGPVSLTWPAALPTPRLDGDTAVYAGVLPGVDLRVRALRDGFTYVFVVHSREAADNPALRELRLGLSTAGGSVQRTADGYRLANGAGKPLGTLGAASMWDSRGKSTAEEASPTARTATPRVEVTDRELVLRPDLDLLTDPRAEFPLYVDPPFYSPWNIWAYATNNNSNNAMEVARVGKNPDSGAIYRSFFRFPAWELHGTTIINASFFAKLVHSWACAASAVNLYAVNDFGVHGRVNWSPPLLGAPLSERWGNAHKGPDACGYQPDQILEFSDYFVNHVQNAASNGATWLAVALSTQRWNWSTNSGYGEGTVEWWKKFDPGNIYMTATFNRTPGVPTPGTVSDCYQACGSPAVTRSLTPELSATVSDPDGGTLRTEFEIWNAASTTRIQSSGTTVTGVPSGSVARWRPPTALAADTSYTWRARACDEQVCGGWTGWRQLRTDATNPAVPGVSSTLYLEDTTGTVNGGIGIPGPFTFTASGSTDVVEYAWSLDGATPVTVAAPSPGAPVTVSITPVRDLVAVLQVTARDAAGRVSSPRTYRFRVTPPPAEAAGWRLNETTGSVADDHIDSRPANRNGTVLWGAPGRADGDTAARFTDVGWFQTTLPVLSTTGSFSVAAWVRLTDTTNYRVVASQDGTSYSMFQLQYRPIENKLCFAVRGSDSAAGPETFACAPGPPQVNTWLHLAGVYDHQAQTITFYVNGGDPDRGGSITTTPFSSPWAATGPFAIGRNRHSGNPGAWWIGEIDEVLAFQRALPLEEVQFLSFT